MSVPHYIYFHSANPLSLPHPCTTGQYMVHSLRLPALGQQQSIGLPSAVRSSPGASSSSVTRYCSCFSIPLIISTYYCCYYYYYYYYYYYCYYFYIVCRCATWRKPWCRTTPPPPSKTTTAASLYSMDCSILCLLYCI